MDMPNKGKTPKNNPTTIQEITAKEKEINPPKIIVERAPKEEAKQKEPQPRALKKSDFPPLSESKPDPLPPTSAWAEPLSKEILEAPMEESIRSPEDASLSKTNGNQREETINQTVINDVTAEEIVDPSPGSLLDINPPHLLIIQQEKTSLPQKQAPIPLPSSSFPPLPTDSSSTSGRSSTIAPTIPADSIWITNSLPTNVMTPDPIKRKMEPEPKNLTAPPLPQEQKITKEVLSPMIPTRDGPLPKDRIQTLPVEEENTKEKTDKSLILQENKAKEMKLDDAKKESIIEKIQDAATENITKKKLELVQEKLEQLEGKYVQLQEQTKKQLKETKQLSKKSEELTEETKKQNLAIDKLDNTKEYLSEKMHNAKEVLKEKAVDTKDFIKEKAMDTKDFLKEKAVDTKSSIVEMADEAKDKLTTVAETTKDKILEAKDFTKDKLSTVSDTTKEKILEAKDFTKEKLSAIADNTKEKILEVKDTANKKGTQLKKKAKRFHDHPAFYAVTAAIIGLIYIGIRKYQVNSHRF